MKLLPLKIIVIVLILLALFLFYKQHTTKKRNIILENLVKQHELVYSLIGKEKEELVSIVSNDNRFKNYNLIDNNQTIVLEYKENNTGDFYGFYFFIDNTKVTKIELFKP
jgi:multisubunit Na+/H+ antiporter MnhC subunit